MLEIKKVAEDLYLAEATPLEVDEAWSTPEPLSAGRLLKELIDIRGGHSSDVEAALFSADPEWIAKSQRPHE